MFAALGVGEVGAIVLVDRQAQTTLEASHMVLEEVGILVEVDRLEGEFAETFATVCIGRGLRCDTAATEFGSCTIL